MKFSLSGQCMKQVESWIKAGQLYIWIYSVPAWLVKAGPTWCIEHFVVPHPCVWLHGSWKTQLWYWQTCIALSSSLQKHGCTGFLPIKEHGAWNLNFDSFFGALQAIQQLQSTPITPLTVPVDFYSAGAVMDIFQVLIGDLDAEGRYLFLNAVANQLRYPNNHTHYFSFILLYLFVEAKQV